MVHPLALIGGLSGVAAFVFAVFMHAHRLRGYRSPAFVTGKPVLSDNEAWTSAGAQKPDDRSLARGRDQLEKQRETLNAAVEAGKRAYREAVETGRVKSKEEQKP